ncbi:MAG: hypothetical protein ACE5GQ_06810, partial [Nitrospinales bacterium]
QLRKSYADVRPGCRVSGSVILGAAGARLFFKTRGDFSKERFKSTLEKTLNAWNRFCLELTVKEAEETGGIAYDIILRASTQDPHSGTNGGPFPVAELQLARLIDRLIGADGRLNLAEGEEFSGVLEDGPAVSALFVDCDGNARPFDNPAAKAVVEIRLAPGNEEEKACRCLQDHLREKISSGFELNLKEDKGASPWITEIDRPVFSVVLEALEIGYGKKPCLYGCGGSIPFVPKLTGALGGISPLCLGAYDPDSRMHEPGESLSMADWLGCARSIACFFTQVSKAFPNPKRR